MRIIYAVKSPPPTTRHHHRHRIAKKSNHCVVIVKHSPFFKEKNMPQQIPQMFNSQHPSLMYAISAGPQVDSTYGDATRDLIDKMIVPAVNKLMGTVSGIEGRDD